MTDLLLGVDIGTSACKVSLLRTADGAVLGSEAVGYAPSSPRPGWMEQEPGVWYEAMCAAIGRSVASHRGAGAHVRAVGIAGQMRGVVLLDRDRSSVRPAILWNDLRCAGEVTEIAARDTARLARITRNGMNTMCTLPKLVWLQRHEQGAWARAHTVLYPKDYVRYRLTDTLATDLSDASGSSLFDVAGQRWSSELLADYGIDPGKLPEVLPATTVAGAVTAAAAAETGLAAGTPVIIGGSDSTVESFSVGLTDARSCKVRLGTSGAISTVVDAIDEVGSAYCWCYVRPDRWMLDTNTRSCGQAVRWLRGLAYSEVTSDAAAFEAIDAEAGAVPLGARGALFHPYLLGEDAPYWDPDLRATVIGLSAAHGRPEVARSVLEGTALALRDAMSTLGRWVPAFERVAFVGGGTRSPVWLAIVADVLGLDGEVPESSDASLGAAMLAGVGVGIFPSLDESVRRCYRISRRVTHDQRNTDRYDALFERYRTTMPPASRAGAA